MSRARKAGKKTVRPVKAARKGRAERPARAQGTLSLADYAKGVRAGNRAVLARAITLIESSRADHRALAQELLTKLAGATGGARRVGISGAPGVGKSTLIDALGLSLVKRGHKVAVLAVDPTSLRSGGSILGDKTRMARLAAEANAYIRPSPASGKLGGVARMTRETMLLCEAAGFDVVLIETVGAGQSETLVADMVDFFLVLVLPGAGDELQGLKKGMIELADMIAVTKADGENLPRAQAARAEYAAALHVVAQPGAAWAPSVATVSAKENKGLDVLWDAVEQHRKSLEMAGALEEKRKAQSVRALWGHVDDALLARLRSAPRVQALLPKIEREVAKGKLTPFLAALRLLEAYAKD
jgi:LAO/AO transport system kinase